jgi:tetratricopeptide (TPR) repeat protein
VDDLLAQQGLEAVSPYESQRLGYLQVRLEETDAGLIWLDRAVNRAMSEGNRALQISTLLFRARAELLLGKRAAVVKDTDEADRISLETGGARRKHSLPIIHQLRAELSMAEGDSAAAMEMLNGVLTDLNYPADRSSFRLAGALTLYARNELRLGRYTQARSTAQQALTLAEAHALKADRSADVGAALMELARAQRALGDDPAANASARRAAASLANTLGPRHSETRAAVAF